MKNNSTMLLKIAGITIPPVGVYDVLDAAPFQPFAGPSQCIFGHYESWTSGESTVINGENADAFGCPGAGYWLCGIQTMPREAVAGYLAGQERLKASTDIMCRWLENHPPYRLDNTFLVISQMKADQYQFLKTVTFFINPDQLALLHTGAEYLNAAAGEGPVMAPFGSGCGQLISVFRDLNAPKAMIGATDIAMRKYLPPDTIAFTVTKPMYEQLCGLDEDSFLTKTFWKDVVENRKKHRAA